MRKGPSRTGDSHFGRGQGRADRGRSGEERRGGFGNGMRSGNEDRATGYGRNTRGRDEQRGAGFGRSARGRDGERSAGYGRSVRGREEERSTGYGRNTRRRDDERSGGFGRGARSGEERRTTGFSRGSRTGDGHSEGTFGHANRGTETRQGQSARQSAQGTSTFVGGRRSPQTRDSGVRVRSDRRFNARHASADRANPSEQSAVGSPNLVTGRHPVLEALKAGRPINKILVSQASEGGSLIEILAKAKAAGVVVQTVPKTVLNSVAGSSHQGIVAYVSPHAYAELDDVLQRETGHPPLVVLLDEVSDPHNLGAILRTSEATGVQGVVIPKRRTVPLTETVAKASAGAIEYVPVARVTNLVQAMERLKEAGYWIVGTAVEGASEYSEVNYTGPVAIVIGAEGSGLSRLVREHCDFLVRLPMLGKLQSLNASVAAGVLLYEVVRQRA